MLCMLGKCCSLTRINLSNFNTQNVITMRSMFIKCKSLKYLDISNFNTQNVTEMDSMFKECKSLIKQNVITNDKKILELLQNL